MLSDQFVEPPYCFPEFGIEVVFYTVVRPGLKINYLPASLSAIADHLLPSSS